MLKVDDVYVCPACDDAGPVTGEDLPEPGFMKCPACGYEAVDAEFELKPEDE